MATPANATTFSGEVWAELRLADAVDVPHIHAEHRSLRRHGRGRLQPTSIVEFRSPAGSCAESSWPIQLGRQPSRCRHGNRQRGRVHCHRCHNTLLARQRQPRHGGGGTSADTGEWINVSKATLTVMCILRTSVSSASHNRERAGSRHRHPLCCFAATW